MLVRSSARLGLTVENNLNMKKEILIASILPAFWVVLAISWIGTPPKPAAPGELLNGGIVLAAMITTIPGAVIAYICGRASKDE